MEDEKPKSETAPDAAKPESKPEDHSGCSHTLQEALDSGSLSPEQVKLLASAFSEASPIMGTLCLMAEALGLDGAAEAFAHLLMKAADGQVPMSGGRMGLGFGPLGGKGSKRAMGFQPDPMGELDPKSPDPKRRGN